MQHINLLPHHLCRSFEGLNLEFAVPKLHINGHKNLCWTRFGFNYRPGVGRTDGEGIERREMREGHRQDVLDDVCNDSNYRKTINLGQLLLSPSRLLHS